MKCWHLFGVIFISFLLTQTQSIVGAQWTGVYTLHAGKDLYITFFCLEIRRRIICILWIIIVMQYHEIRKNKIKDSIIKLIGIAISCIICCLINSVRYRLFIFEIDWLLCCLFFLSLVSCRVFYHQHPGERSTLDVLIYVHFM